MNPTVELVSNHKKANMRKSEFLMLEALKSAPHLNDTVFTDKEILSQKIAQVAALRVVILLQGVSLSATKIRRPLVNQTQRIDVLRSLSSPPQQQETEKTNFTNNLDTECFRHGAWDVAGLPSIGGGGIGHRQQVRLAFTIFKSSDICNSHQSIIVPRATTASMSL